MVIIEPLVQGSRIDLDESVAILLCGNCMRWLFASAFKVLKLALLPPYFWLSIRARLRPTGETPH